MIHSLFPQHFWDFLMIYALLSRNFDVEINALFRNFLVTEMQTLQTFFFLLECMQLGWISAGGRMQGSRMLLCSALLGQPTISRHVCSA